MDAVSGVAQPPATSKLTKEQFELVRYLEQVYWRTSALPSYEALVGSGVDLDQTFYLESWANPRFVDALRARGLPEHVLNTKSAVGVSGKTLTEQQLTVANVLLDVLDTRSRIKKLTELGVPTSTYNLWLRDPVYRQYCLDRAENLLTENQPVAHMSLINRVGSGDLGAIKYFNAMTGRYRERERAAVEVNVNQFGSDKLIQIVEIIQRHVKDPAVLEAIGADILALNNPVQAARLSGSSYVGELVYSSPEEKVI